MLAGLASHLTVKKQIFPSTSGPWILPEDTVPDQYPVTDHFISRNFRLSFRTLFRDRVLGSISFDVLPNRFDQPPVSRAGRKSNLKASGSTEWSVRAAVPLLLSHLFVRRQKRTVDLALLFQTDRFY